MEGSMSKQVVERLAEVKVFKRVTIRTGRISDSQGKKLRGNIPKLSGYSLGYGA